MRRIIFPIMICITFFTALITNVAAQTDEELRALYSNRDIDKMEEIARSGNVKAQTWFGLMLQQRTRFSEALEWYTRAAEAGDFFAIHQTAFLYERGLGTARDIAKAADWHRRGAELGNRSSQLYYANALLVGRGVDKDEARAFHWFQQAADQGERYAFFPLAKLYAQGIGTERDLVKAYLFADKAEKNARGSDYSLRDQAGALKDQVRSMLTPDQLKQVGIDESKDEEPTLPGGIVLFLIAAALLLGGGVILRLRSKKNTAGPA